MTLQWITFLPFVYPFGCLNQNNRNIKEEICQTPSHCHCSQEQLIECRYPTSKEKPSDFVIGGPGPFVWQDETSSLRLQLSIVDSVMQHQRIAVYIVVQEIDRSSNGLSIRLNHRPTVETPIATQRIIEIGISSGRCR